MTRGAAALSVAGVAPQKGPPMNSIAASRLRVAAGLVVPAALLWLAGSVPAGGTPGSEGAATAASTAAAPASAASSAAPAARKAKPKKGAPAPASSAAAPSSSSEIMASGRQPSESARKLQEKSGSPRESLGNVPISDAVRAAAETRKKKESSTGGTKVITSDMIRSSSPSTSSSSPSKAPAPKPPSTSAQTGGYSDYRDSQGRDEAWWRGMTKGARDKISGLEAEIERLQTEIDGLRNDFYNRDDPAYRDGVIKPKWDEAIRAQDRAKEQLSRARLEYDVLLEDARRSGALPGWLR